MSTFRNVTDDDQLPESLTRQWFQPDSDKATKGAEFGTYAVAVDPETGTGMVIPLINARAVARADELAADGWQVSRVADQRLVEVPVTGESKPKVTKAQQEALAAMLAGTATDEQKALLQKLV